MATVPSPRARLGNAGEVLVARRLVDRGFRIVGRNVRVGRLELDIIAERAGLLVFIEVRTRRAGAMVHPAQTVDARKRRRVRQAAAAWMHRTGTRARDVRFDVAAVIAPSAHRAARMLYYPGAF